MSYKNEYQASVSDKEAFWKEKSQLIEWFTPPKTILSKDENGIDRWYSDGELNSCYIALDVHIKAGRGEQAAIIYDSPVSGKKQTFTYSEVLSEVSQLAFYLDSIGLKKGDTAIVYMPMIPQAVFAMLAIARIGAVHSVVFGGFAASELAVRIDDAKPKIILSASCGIEPTRTIHYKPLLDEAIHLSTFKPAHQIIFQRTEKIANLDKAGDINWQDAMKRVAGKSYSAVAVKSTDPLYILYTSGTTGTPKGIVRDNGGHAVAMKYSMKAIYNMDAGDVFWAASDVGWVVGHSYIVYAPLMQGCTTVMFEGKPIGTPDAGAFWRVIEEYKVKSLFAAPTAFRAIKKQDPEAELATQYDLTSLDTLFVAGERLDPPTYHWLNEKFSLPVIDHWWQTETGWAIAANMVGIECLPSKAGSASLPTPGFDVVILDDAGEPVEAGEQGNIAVKLPLPPSCLPTIWQDFERFNAGYLSTCPGYYMSGDGGYLDEDGYLFVMGRIDDVINIAGHRMSTGRMEEVVGAHAAVAECTVIGVNDELKGQVPVAFALLKDGADITEEDLFKELSLSLREAIGAINSLKAVFVVSRLPKTRSGKILRKVMRQIANGDTVVVPSTIDDPASLDDIYASFDRGIERGD